MEFVVFECTSRKKFNPLARLIMYMQKIPFSHMAIMAITDNGMVVYDAVYPRARKIAYGDWLKDYAVIDSYTMKRPEVMPYLALEFLEKLIAKNENYSIAQLILIQAQNTFVQLKRILSRVILNHEKGAVCSEIIARFVAYAYGVKLDEQFDTVDLVEASRVARQYSVGEFDGEYK
jgi:hypothetical protein